MFFHQFDGLMFPSIVCRTNITFWHKVRWNGKSGGVHLDKILSITALPNLPFNLMFCENLTFFHQLDCQLWSNCTFPSIVSCKSITFWHKVRWNGEFGGDWRENMVNKDKKLSMCTPQKCIFQPHFWLKFDVFSAIWWPIMIKLYLNFMFPSIFLWITIEFWQKVWFQQNGVKIWTKWRAPLTQAKMKKKGEVLQESILTSRNGLGTIRFSAFVV